MFRKVGSNCQFCVENARVACSEYRWGDFVKLAVFGSPGKGERLGTECLWDIARKCNPRVRDAVQACREGGGGSDRVVNFIQVREGERSDRINVGSFSGGLSELPCEQGPECC